MLKNIGKILSTRGARIIGSTSQSHNGRILLTLISPEVKKSFTGDTGNLIRVFLELDDYCRDKTNGPATKSLSRPNLELAMSIVLLEHMIWRGGINFEIKKKKRQIELLLSGRGMEKIFHGKNLAETLKNVRKTLRR